MTADEAKEVKMSHKDDVLLGLQGIRDQYFSTYSDSDRAAMDATIANIALMVGDDWGTE